MAAQTARTELETKLREKDVLIERLEGDRRWLAERETEEREEKERERADRAEEKRKADTELRALRTSLATLREEHAELTDEHESLSRSTTQALSTHKSQVTTLTRQVALLQDELSEYRQIAEERAQALETLRGELDDASAANESFTQKAADEETWAVVRAELSRQAEYMRTLEATNAKLGAENGALRERHVSVEVLKEQKRALERKLQGAEALREKVVRLEAELEAARHERATWASESAQPSTPSKTPVSVTKALADLRLTNARLLEEHGSTNAMLKQREAELATADQRITEVEASVEALQADARTLKAEIARKERERELAEREVSFLQAMVASFTAEEAAQNGVDLDELASERLQHLESLVADYKATVQQLQHELDARSKDGPVRGGTAALNRLQEELEVERTSRAELQAALEKAEQASTAHEEQIEELEQTLFELRGEIGAGRHLPPGVRVLTLRDNPAQQWADMSQAAMDRLRKENEALMKRLKELEDAGARVSGQAREEAMVPRESWEVVNREKMRLEEELKQKEKRLLRLQQIFQSKSAEFREAVASILGVKLAFYPNGQVRVTSYFDLNAAFVFQPTGPAGNTDGPGGMRMQLVAQGDGGPEDLPQLMRYWVEQEQCIPGFLASVTLECYEKHKMEMERGKR
ncbi:MAD-domain-containing protein [Daedalea quercina L-15889]|uniref:Spindle assembly checkpoint component MAD1 n=1 Tax=Daedalea quercina L-15889 TaxID=1314783 RepID=A0A165LPI5_9APHY|nr:MAD-domain-containing protein [Daedalea quercina L-15889]